MADKKKRVVPQATRNLSPTDRKVLGDILRERRLKAGFSLGALAQRTDPRMSIITISRIENGHLEPKLVSLQTLARALECKVVDLVSML